MYHAFFQKSLNTQEPRKIVLSLLSPIKNAITRHNLEQPAQSLLALLKQRNNPNPHTHVLCRIILCI